MSHEIRLRLPLAFYVSLSAAAATRGIATTALASMAIHEFLRERGELTPMQATAKPPVALKPDVDMSVWHDDD